MRIPSLKAAFLAVTALGTMAVFTNEAQALEVGPACHVTQDLKQELENAGYKSVIAANELIRDATKRIGEGAYHEEARVVWFNPQNRTAYIVAGDVAIGEGKPVTCAKLSKKLNQGTLYNANSSNLAETIASADSEKVNSFCKERLQLGAMSTCENLADVVSNATKKGAGIYFQGLVEIPNSPSLLMTIFGKINGEHDGQSWLSASNGVSSIDNAYTFVTYTTDGKKLLEEAKRSELGTPSPNSLN